ncbi:hypothetical protein BLA29_003669 [Euroglyphus maynei]|uniref:Uncharacterized protein n=1 Tax=Euroglyphus maynei TaxID=6958 RepID=A0A1Y3BRT3_EURMA|nr:hypothetical protein BLA29_003669 [Euroglyphus maynei]
MTSTILSFELILIICSIRTLPSALSQNSNRHRQLSSPLNNQISLNRLLTKQFLKKVVYILI